MENLLIIPIVSMAAYLLYVYKKYGMTKSISATFQRLQKKEKILMPITLWLTAFPIMIVGVLKAPTLFTQVLFGIAGTLILLISVSPMYWKSETKNNRNQALLHYVGSYGGIGIGMIACLLSFTSLSVILIIGAYLLFVASQMLLKWKFVNNHIYWIEVIAIIISVGLEYFN
jgi:hypothetical protein